MTSSGLLDTMLGTAREGVWLLDADGRTAMTNARMAELLGTTTGDLVGRDALEFLDRIPPGEGEELWLRRPDGSGSWVLVVANPVVGGPGEPAGLLLMVSDLTDRKSAEAALVHQASHDTLTGLPNRALFLDRLRHALSRSTRSIGGVTAVLFLDLDRFKHINDVFGHAVGDLVLIAVADRLRSVLRSGDTVARLGGDEFVLVCEELADRAEAVGVAERVAAALAEPLDIGDHELTLTVSTGVAVTTGDATPDSLLRDADFAMYRAKELGRDRVELSGEDARERTVARLQTKSDLRRAVESKELEVHYQPVVALASARVVGVEALVRWSHPTRGNVPPIDFIPLAEDNGLIVPIGALVLNESCRRVAGWNRRHPRRPPLTLAVNLSARQLAAAGLSDMVAQALDTSGLDPRLLCLEITESVLMHDTAGNRAMMAALKDQGITLAIDDFGTGWSSLLYLRQFPVDLLKIDRSFVAGLGQSPADEAIVAGVVGLAKGLGLAAVAEGVETAEQYFALAEMGCDMGQGHYWSRACDADEIELWLEDAWTEVLPPVAAVRPRATRVLVADDQAEMRDMIKLVLEMEGGFELVDEAGNGWEAVELARRHQPDLVLLDIVMPGLGGPQALPHVRQAAPSAKVVLLTSLDLASLDPDTVASSDGCYDKTVDMSVMAAQLAAMFPRT